MKKPLFIPLKTEFFEDFKNGSRTEELRRYGPGWNEKTCFEGREVVLSKGYGNHDRLKGEICRFKKQHGSIFGPSYKWTIRAIYGTFNIDIACISIINIRPVKSVEIKVKTLNGTCSLCTKISVNDWEQMSDNDKKSHVRDAMRQLDISIFAADDDNGILDTFEVR